MYTNDNLEFDSILTDIISNPTVQEMKNFKQHYDTSCYDHCLNVALISYKICKKFNLDYTSVTRASMLHDLFLYDWRYRQDDRKGLHAFTHPTIALSNAKKIVDLTPKEEDIILKHMWPLTLKFPKYKESYVVTLADKYSALAESFNYYKKSLKKLIKY